MDKVENSGEIHDGTFIDMVINGAFEGNSKTGTISGGTFKRQVINQIRKWRRGRRQNSRRHVCRRYNYNK